MLKEHDENRSEVVKQAETEDEREKLSLRSRDCGSDDRCWPIHAHFPCHHTHLHHVVRHHTASGDSQPTMAVPTNTARGSVKRGRVCSANARKRRTCTSNGT